MVLVFIFELIVFLFSAVIHEVSHGVMAEKLGDPTARLAGRLTLNPLKHLDPFGSVVLPLLLAIPALFGQPTFIFGWAKPVPYNPANLKDPKGGAAKIAAAGPISNFVLAAVFGIAIRILTAAGMAGSALVIFLSIIIYVNLLLGVFNLVPLPPLDGSKVLYAFLPPTERGYATMRFMERYGMMLVLLFIFFGFELLIPIINALFLLFAGQPFGV
jgi:Zn-dependent protease